jgi:HAE1 family hydrophobic/amphiphilic exporter-1
MFRIFIQRPVLATVVSILLVLLGGLGLATLPVTQFPDIAPPSVSVMAVYPGASAEVVARSVATPLEEAINGVENMTYMTSTSSNDGSMSINVYFRLGTDPDQAAVNVQNRVAAANGQLPGEVLQTGVSTFKQQNSMIMVLDLYSADNAYDETFLQNYAKINLLPEIKRVPGVGQAMVFGNKDYAMRVWLDPAKLAGYNLVPGEVMAAIRDQNLEAAPGKFGEGSKEAFEYVLKYKGKLSEQGEYENIVIRADEDGSLLRLKDVARIEFGSFTYAGNTRSDGKEGIVMGVFQTAGSNANEIQEGINEVMARAARDFPAGVQSRTIYSTKTFLDQSITQVKHTLIEAFILVFLVVFIFLQDFRSTLIPAIAVPVAIIGTFFFMGLFGFSINLLTLFALVLAIGIVVDDAIVVVEAVHTKMQRTGLPARKATISAMSEITGAIISITLVMSAVFLPVGFMQGPVGVFYRQFAFTMAIAILISAVNALTLSPALCALFLKHGHGEHAEPAGRRNFVGRFFGAFNAGFDAVTRKYVRTLQFLVRRKWVALGSLAVVGAATFLLMRTTPTGFIPNEDQSFVVYSLGMPPGASLARTQAALDKVDNLLKTVPAVKTVIRISGLNLLSNSSSPSFGVGFINLKPIEERGEVKEIGEVMNQINAKLAAVKEGGIFVFTMPTVPGFGNIDGLEMVLQDRTGGSIDKFSSTANAFVAELVKRKEIGTAFTTFNSGYPQYQFEINEVKSKQLGVNVSDILQTMQAYYGSMMASDFNRFGKYYRVIVQAEAANRAEPASLGNIFVKNRGGGMVPLNTLVSLKRVYGPESINHFNLFNSITVNALPKKGFSTGDAIKAVEEVASKGLPRGYTYEWTGMTKEEINSGGQSTIIFLLCLVFVYFLLAAQYESYILPLSVILSIPLGIFGVFVFINLFGIDNNIYVQVGLIMLIGLLAKNAILIVEYALQRRKAGASLLSSALQAAQLRLRPVLMTSLAFIAGIVPLMSATGASALGNRSISTGAAGGMLIGVVLGVLIIPVLFVIFQHLQERITGKPQPTGRMEDETPEPVVAGR